jgi:hypothetical protein
LNFLCVGLAPGRVFSASLRDYAFDFALGNADAFAYPYGTKLLGLYQSPCRKARNCEPLGNFFN